MSQSDNGLVFEIAGPTATLRLYDERVEVGGDGARLLIPLRCCVMADIDEFWARDGSVALRLELDVDLGLGSGDSVAVFLRFPTPCRVQLERLVERVRRRGQPEAAQPEATTGPTLARLAVTEAPDTDDWLSFRPLRSIAEVLEPVSRR